MFTDYDSKNVEIETHGNDTKQRRGGNRDCVRVLPLIALFISIIALATNIGTLVYVHSMVESIESQREIIEPVEIADEMTAEDVEVNGEKIVIEPEPIDADTVTRGEYDAIIEKALAHDTLTTDGEYAYNPENNMIETWYSSRTTKFPEYQMRDWTVGADGVWRDKDGYVIACAPSFGTDDIDGDDAERMTDKGYVKAYERGEEISTTFGPGKVYDLSPLPCVITDKDGMRYGFMSVYTDWRNAK